MAQIKELTSDFKFIMSNFSSLNKYLEDQQTPCLDSPKMKCH